MKNLHNHMFICAETSELSGQGNYTLKKICFWYVLLHYSFFHCMPADSTGITLAILVLEWFQFSFSMIYSFNTQLWFKHTFFKGTYIYMKYLDYWSILDQI